MKSLDCDPPIEASLFCPIIWTHSTTAAPELSMQLISDCARGQRLQLIAKTCAPLEMAVPLIGASCPTQSEQPLAAAVSIGEGRLKRDVISKSLSLQRAGAVVVKKSAAHRL